MFCRKCGEENPENAVYCRNCGEKLIEDVKKAEVIEAPKDYHEKTTQTNTTSSSSKDDGSNWLTCCLCLIGIFIIFAIIGSL